MSEQPRAASEIRTGDVIGHFEVGRLIARGGTADVWRGHDGLLDRSVAIKHLLIDPAASTSEVEAMRERFRAETELLKRVAGQGDELVSIIDLVDDPRGMFLVMEFVEGMSLEQALIELPGPNDLRKAIGILLAVARALKIIHEAGIVHRDLKPSNILLTRDGGLKVCDFGLAAMLGDQELMSEGSVRYMAPELFGGEPVDGRADIYALGVITYEMVLGRAAFEEVFKVVLRDRRNQPLRWMKWHTNRRAVATPLAEAAPQAGADAVPQPLSDLVARMMAKDPTQRIASAGDLLDAVQRHFTHEGRKAARAKKPRRRGKDPVAVDTSAPTAPLPRRSTLPWIVAAALVVVAVVAATPVVFSRMRDARIETVARQEALQDLKEAKAAFGRRDYQQAQMLFTMIREDPPDDDALVRQCEAYALLCQAMRDHGEGKHEDAVERIAQADGLRAIRDRNLIADLRREVELEHAFDVVMETIRKAIDEDRLEDAQRLLRERQRGGALTRAQQERVDALGTEVEGRLAQRFVSRRRDEIRGLIEKDELEEAASQVAHVLEQHPDAELSRIQEEIRRLTEYRRLMGMVKQARRANDRVATLKFLKMASLLAPPGELELQIRTLNGQIAFEEGQNARDARAARDAYIRAAGFGHAGAKALLAEMNLQDRIESFRDAGRTAAAQGEFEVAIEHFTRAKEAGGGAAVDGDLSQARVRLHLRTGRRALERDDIDAARAALGQAAAIDPDDAAVRRGQADLRRRTEYLEYVGRGDEARQRGAFGKAKRAYRRARKIMDTPEVEQRLRNAEFDHLVAQARHYIQVRQWLAAQAKLRSAREIHVTPAVDEMLGLVAGEIEKETP
ncbi:MAG: hypothetical protein CMJ18_28025 [Phycisphaeraceae bacterium]|nr:hypothetical protein [Phycisphaeraceae bacterium]